LVETINNKFGFIDSSGKEAISAIYSLDEIKAKLQ